MNDQRKRILTTLALLLPVAVLLYTSRAALLPFIVGTLFAYLLLPLVNWVDSYAPSGLRGRRWWRGFMVFVVYLLAAAVVLGSLALIIPAVVAQVNLLTQRLPELARKAYSAAPQVMRAWVDGYNCVPENIRQTLQHSMADAVQPILSALPTGAFRALSAILSTLSFMLGLLVLPLWTFYLLRDEPQVSTLFYRLIPPAYRADAESIQALVNLTLGSYLRGQLILCLSVGIMFTLGLLLLGVDYALLLGTIAGILEVVPALGPFLGTIPAVLVALATSPSQLLKVIVLALAVQQIENTFLVPQVTGETVNLHPALVMLLLVVGSAVGGIWGVILSVPLTALIRDLVHYLYLRLADEPLAPHAALARVRATHSA